MQAANTLIIPIQSHVQKARRLDVKIPNIETLEAINEIKKPDYRKKTKKFTSVENLMADLNSIY